VFVELKIPGGRLSAIQAKTIKQLKDIGAVCYVAFDIEEFKAIIDRHHPGPE